MWNIYSITDGGIFKIKKAKKDKLAPLLYVEIKTSLVHEPRSLNWKGSLLFSGTRKGSEHLVLLHDYI